MSHMINAVDKLMKLDGVPLSRLEVQATLRLQNDPRQAIRLARGGSYYDIYAIVNNGERGFPSIPPKLQETLFEAFCFHLAKPREFLEMTKDKTSQTSVIMFSLLGITLFEGELFQRNNKCATLLVRSWPDMLRWLEFLYDEPLPNWPSKTGFPSGLIKMIHSIVEMVSECPEARDIFQGLDLFKLAAKIWMEDKRSQDDSDEFYAASILSMSCETIEDLHERLDMLIEMSQDREWDVAGLAVNRLKCASKRALRQPDLVSAFNHIEVLYQLSRTKDHPLHLNILAYQPIPIVLKCLLRCNVLSTPSQKDNLGILTVRVFDLLAIIIDNNDRALMHTVEALRCGILEAFVRSGPFMKDFNTEDNWASAFQLLRLMTRQLSLVTLLGPTIKAFERLEGRGAGQLPGECSSEFKEQWNQFKKFAYERWICKLMHDRRRLCSNTKCGRPNSAGTFRRCAACESVFYCGRECQRVAWKTGGHRADCKAIRQTTRKSELKQADRDFLVDNAAAEIHRHMPGLKKIAERDCPGASQSQIVFRIDYITYPPRTSLRKHILEGANQAIMNNMKGDLLWLEVRVPLGGNSYEMITHFNFARNLWKESPEDVDLPKNRLNFCDQDGNPLEVRGDIVSQILCVLERKAKEKGVHEYDSKLLSNIVEDVLKADREKTFFRQPTYAMA